MPYYFAYGPNMLMERLRSADRVPTAKAVSHARLEGWRLQFDKVSEDGSGKCDIVRSPGDVVCGVVYSIPTADLGNLDRLEDLDHGYILQRLAPVVLGDGSLVRTLAHVAEPGSCQPGLLPYEWYRDLVVAGAEQHNLPSDYLAWLKSAGSQPDPIPARPERTEAFSLIADFNSRRTNGLFQFHAPCSSRRIPEPRLEQLAESTLYYPCSGRDWEVPLRLFGPWVRNVRFVDPQYFCYGGALPPKQLRVFPEWEFLDRRVDGDLTQRISSGLGPHIEEEIPGFQPLTVSERYRHRPTGHELTIHMHRADGRKTLDRFSEPIGVFFHRGDTGPHDSPGEGASGSHWLSKAWLNPVIERMVNKGFIVTDGSCGREYPELLRFRGVSANAAEAAVAEGRTFESDGVHFECVGFAGMGNSPTMIWQITK